MRFFIICIFLLSCNNSSVHADYYKNLNVVKSVASSINTYFNSDKPLDISQYYTDDFIFYSYPAGYKKGIKTSKFDYINNLDEMKKMNMSINIGNCIYLPGINEISYDLDGSVRVYYGATMAIDTNIIEFSGYRTINLKDGKIEGIWEWADYGGVKNQLNQFYK